MISGFKRFCATDKSDISLNRIYGAVKRRIFSFPDTIAWNLNGNRSKRNKEKLNKFKNIHRGERCFIIGNGPSLNKTDLSKLKNEITFGMNRIYLLFEKLGFTTTYFTAINDLVIDQFKKDIIALNIPKFIPWKHRRDFHNYDDFLFIHHSFKEIFAHHIYDRFGNGGTVTYTCLQLAYHMGFKEVYLIGIDHNFKDKGVSGKIVVSEGNDQNHFDSNYFGKGIKWGLPNLFLSERAYALTRRIYEKNNIIIRDATIDGKLKVFEKVSYDSLF